MEVGIGVDELAWSGMSTIGNVMPLRRLFDQQCVSPYCTELEFVDFALRVQSEVEDKLMRVRTSELKKNIGLNIIFAGGKPNEARRLADLLSESVEKVAAYMDRQSRFEFDTATFLREAHAAIDDYRSQFVPISDEEGVPDD